MLAIRLGPPTSPPADETAATSAAAASHALQWGGDHDRITLTLHIAGDDADPPRLAQGTHRGHRWICVGALFDVVTHARVRPETVVPWVVDDPEWLAAHCWGLYRLVVFREEDAMLRLYIDPCGQRPMYFQQVGSETPDTTRRPAVYLASDVPTLIRITPQAAATPDMHFLHSMLLHGNGTEGRTALLGIDSVPLGGMLEARPGQPVQCSEVWRPLRADSPYAALRRIDPTKAATLPQRIDMAQSPRLSDRLAARDDALSLDAFRLLQTVTDAYLSSVPADPTVLELSGGLESSALALALHEAGRTQDLTGINHFDHASPASNEIVYAQAVSDHCGFALRTMPMDMAPYAPPQALATTASMPRHPRPSQGSIMLNWSQQLRERTADLSGATHLNGYGGDAGFLAPPYFSTWLDAVHDGAWRRAPMAIHDMALLRRTPYWQVIRQGWKESRSRNLDDMIQSAPPATIRIDTPCPSPDRLGQLPALRALLRRQPGKHMQLLGLMGNLAEIEMYPDLGFKRSFFPYLTQPMIEYVLNYPSYALYSRFHNRVPMRRAAFAASGMPHLWRRDKGETSGPFTRGWRENADHIRQVVMEGWCAQAGLVDRDACDRATRLAISGFRPPDLSLDRIYACEMFMQAWQSRSLAPASR
ncbi:asparagine synthase-related protein [Robbsia sp. KACC 23696]|uniref:asparagine synthase-related protein n=1 Tax=Robbsia sp. KACC 23696 TaxID=3149231 RepID=UPI00325AF8C4